MRISDWSSDVFSSDLLDPQRGSDIAQSLLNQADQNGGVWDRWTHLTGATGVMNGDPSPPALAAIYAFGGRAFDVKAAYASLKRAARSEEHTSEPVTNTHLVCRLLCETKKQINTHTYIKQ